MPTKRSRRTSAIRPQLTPEIERYLLSGDWHGEVGEGLDAFLLAGAALRGGYGQLQAIWQEHRDAILESWIREQPAGTRPFSWWIFDAPESRKCVADQGNHLAHLEPRQAEIIWRRGFGIPAIDQIGCFTIAFESEATYLARHNLLSAEERARLPRGAFEPEIVTVDAPDFEEVTAERGRTT